MEDTRGGGSEPARRVTHLATLTDVAVASPRLDTREAKAAVHVWPAIFGRADVARATVLVAVGNIAVAPLAEAIALGQHKRIQLHVGVDAHGRGTLMRSRGIGVVL